MRPAIAYEPALDAEKRDEHTAARQICLHTALALDDLLPDCREKAVVMTKLEEVYSPGNRHYPRLPR